MLNVFVVIQVKIYTCAPKLMARKLIVDTLLMKG